MKYLAIDTSGEYLTVIAKNNSKKSVHFAPTCGVKHSVNLMPAVERALAEADLKLSDADFFCAVTGPGSFTGIRIGVSTVKALADSLKKPVIGVTTLEAIAYTVGEGKRLSVIDAKHDHFYVEGFDGEAVTVPPKYAHVSEVLELAKSYKLIAYRPIEGLSCEITDVSMGLERAVEALVDRQSDDTNSLSPFYLRLSQAEEGRK